MAEAADDLVATPQADIGEKAGFAAARYCLVVEPEAALQQNYGAALVESGFGVVISHSVSAVLADSEINSIDPPAVMMVAVNDYVEYHEPRLQRLQGQLLRLRKQWPSSSLMVLADGTPAAWLHALAVDDLLPKIAPLATIVARCQQAATRFSRRQPGTHQPWQKLLGNIDEQSDAGLLRFGGQRRRLTLSEYAVFARLLRANGDRCSYAELSKAIGYPVDPLSLMAILQALQLRLADTLSGILEVVHIPHYGYQLNTLGNQFIAGDSEALNESLRTGGASLLKSGAVGQER